ncbi:hypothetical protein ACN27F_30645 [Solwaraspora sp. WMMB335]|uniref:hypothetical protein n=1 Tax=Solwaraspora sp. WMMB335 TaxID=3404118 RepID=UPI003B96739F
MRRLVDRLDKPLGVLGVLFLLLVIGQFVSTHPTTSAVLVVASWVLWAVVVAEFSLRAWLARHHPGRFRRRN